MPGGRPSKLSPELQQNLIDAIAAGNYYETACTYAGIDYSTFRRWMEKGEKQQEGEFREFREAVLQAEARNEVGVVARWTRAIDGDWRAGRDLLARRYPDRWGQHDRITHEGGATPIGLLVTGSNDAERKAAATAALAAGRSAIRKLRTNGGEVALEAGEEPPDEKDDAGE